jgi:hypothetical protein
MKIRYKHVKVSCKGCKRKFKIACTQSSYDEWHHGEALIEDTLHYLNDEERGLLSARICTQCAGVLK